MKTFDFEPTVLSHTYKTRVLKLWNPTASPLGRSVATQSPEERVISSLHQADLHIKLVQNRFQHPSANGPGLIRDGKAGLFFTPRVDVAYLHSFLYFYPFS